MRKDTILCKALLLLLALTSFCFATAQEPCEIICNVEMPVCSGTEIVLSVPNNYQYTFQWYRNGVLLTGQTRNTLRTNPVRPENTSHPTNIYEIEYGVKIFDQDSILVCDPYPTFTVGVKPLFNIDFRQTQLTCSNREMENGGGRTAKVMAMVDSLSAAYEPPFVYEWQVSPLHIASPTLAVGLEAYKFYHIKVTDGRGCTQKDSISPRAYLNPRIEISTDPGDTVYIQNPHVSYSFENQEFSYKGEDDLVPKDTLISVSDFYWVMNSTYNLTSTEYEPRFTYVETGDFTTELKVYNPEGCDTSYYHTIRVEPVKLKIPNVFTPNGDNTNDYFIISLDGGSDLPSGNESPKRGDNSGSGMEYEGYEPLSRYYESTELTVFNRWGRVVYHSKDYQNDWDGDNLSDGTYFYVLKCHGLKNDATYQGSVMIIRTSRQNTGQ